MAYTNYKDRWFSVLGDSISTLSGFHPPENAVFYDWEKKRQARIYGEEDTWWGIVLQKLGARLLMNNAWSGSLVCRHPQCEIESFGCSDARTGSLGVGEIAPDVIMVFMGLNDFGWAMQPEAAAGETGLGIFSVAYTTMLKKLRNNYPNAEIWCMTLPISTWSQHPDFVPPMIRGGRHLTEYNRVIHTVAEREGCRTVELFDARNPYDTIDGYHPTAEGMKTIAEAVLRSIQSG